jgi:uncharacterized protein (TIGR02246 family)
MASDPTERQNFIHYPTNRVVGTVADVRSAQAAVSALNQAGFDKTYIDVLYGEEGMHRLDPGGAEHGFLSQFQRTLLRTAAPVEEYKHLMDHVEDVKGGRFVVMVLAPRPEQRTLAAGILNAHGATSVGFYGRWAWEGLSLVEATGPDTSSDRDGESHFVATLPEQVPALFAEAWNAGDPDGLASLFAQDAEFVNVAGLWWHDRATIRQAYAYGLERMFSEATLTVEEVRTTLLSDRIVVVHARMVLSGQSPVADIERPRPRTNILSFVVCSQDGAWLCASAHSTDVRPGMETNVVDETGALRAASYRTGKRF